MSANKDYILGFSCVGVHSYLYEEITITTKWNCVTSVLSITSVLVIDVGEFGNRERCFAVETDPGVRC